MQVCPNLAAWDKIKRKTSKHCEVVTYSNSLDHPSLCMMELLDYIPRILIKNIRNPVVASANEGRGVLPKNNLFWSNHCCLSRFVSFDYGSGLKTVEVKSCQRVVNHKVFAVGSECRLTTTKMLRLDDGV